MYDGALLPLRGLERQCSIQRVARTLQRVDGMQLLTMDKITVYRVRTTRNARPREGRGSRGVLLLLRRRVS